MASEIRVNRLSNRSGLSTITFANGGVQFSGITTFANGDFRVGTGATILNPSANEMQFHTGGSNRFTINNSGANLGTGNITAVDATFSGNVSIGKTLTYEDVKNVDSVGVVTARTGVKITGGDFTVGTAITASSVTGNVTNDVGITTYSGSAVWFKGATANKDMYWSHASGATVYKDNAQILMGDGSDLQISHDGSHSWINNVNASQNLIIESQATTGIRGSVVHLTNVDGSHTLFEATAGGSIDLYHNNSKKLETTSSGISITGNISLPSGNLYTGDNRKLMIGTSDDLQLFHDGTHSRIYNTTGNLSFRSSAYYFNNAAGTENCLDIVQDGAVSLYYNHSKKFETTTSGIEVSGQIQMNDGNILRLGNDGDLQIYHTGSSSHVSDRGGAGSLFIESNDLVAIRQNDTSNYMAKFEQGAAVKLYYNNSQKFETTSSGVTVNDWNLELKAGSGSEARFSIVGNNASSDAQWFRFTSYNGVSKWQNMYSGGWETNIECNGDGNVELYYNDGKKFETISAGAKITGDLTFSSVSDDIILEGGKIYGETSASNAFTIQNTNGNSNHSKIVIGDNYGSDNGGITFYGAGSSTTDVKMRIRGNTDTVEIPDSHKLCLGNSSDLQLYHDGSNSHITNTYDSGYLHIKSDNISLAARSVGENMILASKDAAVTLFYDGSTRFATTNNGAEVTGGGRFVIDGNATGGTARINMTRSDTSWGIHNETHFRIYSGSGNTETPGNLQFSIVSGGATNLYWGTTLRAETTSTGFRINATSQYALEVYGASSSSEQFSLRNTSSGGLCKIGFQQSDTDGLHHRAYITSYKKSGEDGNYQGTLQIETRGGNKARWTQGGSNHYSEFHIKPWTNNSRNIGGASYRWSTVYSQNSLNTSDRNLKNTIEVSDLGLSFVNKLNPVSYKFNEVEGEEKDTKTHYGLIAQEVEEVLDTEGKSTEDFAAVVGEEGTYSLAYNELLSPLIKAVQELSAKVDALEAKVATLEIS